jgi:hypothetical protein
MLVRQSRGPPGERGVTAVAGAAHDERGGRVQENRCWAGWVVMLVSGGHDANLHDMGSLG